MNLFNKFINVATGNIDMAQKENDAYLDALNTIQEITSKLDELNHYPSVVSNGYISAEDKNRIGILNYQISNFKNNVYQEKDKEKYNKKVQELIEMEQQYNLVLDNLKNKLLNDYLHNNLSSNIQHLNYIIMQNASYEAFHNYIHCSWNLDMLRQLENDIAVRRQKLIVVL